MWGRALSVDDIFCVYHQVFAWSEPKLRANGSLPIRHSRTWSAQRNIELRKKYTCFLEAINSGYSWWNPAYFKAASTDVAIWVTDIDIKREEIWCHNLYYSVHSGHAFSFLLFEKYICKSSICAIRLAEASRHHADIVAASHPVSARTHLSNEMTINLAAQTFPRSNNEQNI